MVVTLIRCGLQKCANKLGMTGLCGHLTHIQEPDTHPPPPNSTPNSCETLNMESEMQRLNRELHNPHKIPEDNHYSTPNKHLKEVLKHVHESAIAGACAAYQSDTAHQRQEEETR